MAEPLKIFIVEDERRIARYLQMELEHEGFQAESEDNGRRAFERIIQGDYALVLLDVMLPEMDGMTICRKVRELSDVPIIMLSRSVSPSGSRSLIDQLPSESDGPSLCTTISKTTVSPG